MGKQSSYLTIHPRHIPVETAKTELGKFLHEWRTTHSLTSAEYLMLLAEEMKMQLAMHVSSERREAE